MRIEKRIYLAKERANWAVPVGGGRADASKLNLGRVLQLNKSGVTVEVDADDPANSKIVRVIVEGMPAPKKDL